MTSGDEENNLVACSIIDTYDTKESILAGLMIFVHLFQNHYIPRYEPFVREHCKNFIERLNKMIPGIDLFNETHGHIMPLMTMWERTDDLRNFYLESLGERMKCWTHNSVEKVQITLTYKDGTANEHRDIS